MKSTFLFSAFTCVISSFAFAQDAGTDLQTVGVTVPEMAIMDIEPAASKNLSFTFTHNGESGTALVNPAPNTSLWVNYSAVVSSTNQWKQITAELDALIPGVDISIAVANAAGAGGGNLGDPIGTSIELTEAPQNIIGNIGSSYTGNGASNGHQLTYEVTFADSGTAQYEDLRSDSSNEVTVTYTILDL